jgi:hypothetical protein
MAAAAQRLAALEAEVAELRAAAALREAFIDAIEAKAYARGRESILGRQAAPRPSRPQHLRPVQDGPGAEIR